ncbi:MAG TPA: spermidine/putrescine ABC transporter substrate-binding protein [Ilumatobacter sp.]|nr:spermidine/putrescine ABC transporter substrate-binding protein [Ilumatobacter sp.]
MAHTGGFVLVVGAGGSLLAACGGDDDAGDGDGDGDDSSGSSGTIPLARLDAPVELPDNDSSPIDSGLDPESGTLTIFTYADYINPDSIAAFEEQYGVTVELATFDTEARLLSGLQTTAYDLVVGATTIGLPRFVVGNLVQPLNRDYLTNFANVLPSLQSPYYDVGSRYSVPYTVYTTGLAYRRDVIDDAAIAATGWETMWDPANRGYVGIIDDPRDALTLGMYRLGITDTNTDDPDVIGQARDAIAELITTTNARIDILAYQKIPEGTSRINQAWSGDMLAAQYYLPEDTDVDVLGYWAPERTTVANDFFVIPADSEHPVLAHHFIDFLSDPDNATLNFEWVGYQPALADPTPEALVTAELVPSQLTTALVTDEQVENGYRLDALAPEVQKLWEDAFQQVKAG